MMCANLAQMDTGLHMKWSSILSPHLRFSSTNIGMRRSSENSGLDTRVFVSSDTGFADSGIQKGVIQKLFSLLNR